MSIERAAAAVQQVFPERSITAIDDLNRGRGVFSEVFRVTFSPSPSPATSAHDGGPNEPATVAVKLAIEGPNGDAARRSGAYEREALAYQTLLPHLNVASPTCHAVLDEPSGPTFVLDDLSALRFVDQIDGLGEADAVAVATALGRLHQSPTPNHVDLSRIRTNTVAGLDPAALQTGLDTLTERWTDHVDATQHAAFALLVENHGRVAARFADAGPTVLCHGDPRADNLAFSEAPVFFDWQQIARQPGVGDLAWLAATSLEPAVRNSVEADLVAAYGDSSGHAVTFDNYRVGYALPGLAVLYLAQRQATDDRTIAFIGASLRRIGQALVDLDVASA